MQLHVVGVHAKHGGHHQRGEAATGSAIEEHIGRSQIHSLDQVADDGDALRQVVPLGRALEPSQGDLTEVQGRIIEHDHRAGVPLGPTPALEDRQFMLGAIDCALTEDQHLVGIALQAGEQLEVHSVQFDPEDLGLSEQGLHLIDSGVAPALNCVQVPQIESPFPLPLLPIDNSRRD